MTSRRSYLILGLVITIAALAMHGDRVPQSAEAGSEVVDGEAFRVFYGDGLHNMGWNEVEVYLPNRGFAFVEAGGDGGALRVFRPDPTRYQRGKAMPRQEPWSVGRVQIPKRTADDLERLLTEQERLRSVAAQYLKVDDTPIPVARWRTENSAAGEWVDYFFTQRGITSTRKPEESGTSIALVEAADFAEARSTLEHARARQLGVDASKAADLDFTILAAPSPGGR